MKKEKIESIEYIGSSQGYLGKINGKNVRYPEDLDKLPAIYLIASLHEKGHDAKASAEDRKKYMHRDRTWGWYPTLAEAKQAVKNNAGDMAECCSYTHVVIERVRAGIPSCETEEDSRLWFKWEVGTKNNPHGFWGKWVPCKTPTWAVGIIGFTIG